MSTLQDLPPILFVRAVWLRLRGGVHFPRDRVGEVVAGEAEDYRVFRQMVVDPIVDEARPPGARLDVRFRFRRLSPAANRWLSHLPMPFIAVQPGFRSKTWMIGERSGTFRGVYEWAAAEDAERYVDSFPMRMMRRRAAERTMETSITPMASTAGERSVAPAVTSSSSDGVRSEGRRGDQPDRGLVDDQVDPARGVVVKVARGVSNVVSGHLRGAGYERRPYPDWDVGRGEAFVLSNVRVVDVDRGTLADADLVVVEGDEIVELATSDHTDSIRARYPGARMFDGGGRFLVPGLSDIHCHVSLVTEFGVGARQIRYLDGQRLRNVEAALEQGCTFVRDCGGAVEQIGHLRSEIDAGRLVGPRIITSMNAISPRGGMWDVGRVMSMLAEPLFGGRNLRFPGGRDELIAAMTEIDDSGCDFFKTYFEHRPLYGGDEDDSYTMFDPEEAATIRSTADRFGKPVSAHAMFLAGARRAIDAGVDVLDHLTVDEPYGVDDAERMAAQGTAIVPTLSVGTFLAMNCGSRGYPDDPEVEFFAEQRTRHGRRQARHVAVPQLRPNYEQFFDWLDEPREQRKMPMIGPVWATRVHGFARHAPTNIERLRAAGVIVGVGTDGGTGITFCGHLDTELAALHRYGYTNAEILRMATLGNMEIVGHADRLGSLEPGKLADMLLVEGNPLDDLDALGAVTAVIKGGRLCHGTV